MYQVLFVKGEDILSEASHPSFEGKHWKRERERERAGRCYLIKWVAKKPSRMIKKTSQTEKVHPGWKFRGGGNVFGIEIIPIERFECNN